MQTCYKLHASDFPPSSVHLDIAVFSHIKIRTKLNRYNKTIKTKQKSTEQQAGTEYRTVLSINYHCCHNAPSLSVCTTNITKCEPECWMEESPVGSHSTFLPWGGAEGWKIKRYRHGGQLWASSLSISSNLSCTVLHTRRGPHMLPAVSPRSSHCFFPPWALLCPMRLGLVQLPSQGLQCGRLNRCGGRSGAGRRGVQG